MSSPLFIRTGRGNAYNLSAAELLVVRSTDETGSPWILRAYPPEADDADQGLTIATFPTREMADRALNSLLIWHMGVHHGTQSGVFDLREQGAIR